jgi:hypothetical protein
VQRLSLIFVLLVFAALAAGIFFRHRLDPPEELTGFPSTPAPKFDPMASIGGSGVLPLRVVAAETGEAVRDAAVVLRSGGAPVWGFTDNQGRIRFDALATGTVQVAVLSWPRPPLEVEVAVANSGEERTLTLAAPKEAPEPLPEIERAPLRGSLTHALGGDPANYDVVLLPSDPPEVFGGAVPARATADASGAFAFEDLALARYRVAIVPQWARGSRWPDLADPRASEIDHRGERSDVRLAIAAGAIEGRVLDDGGRALEGVLVLATPAADESRPWPPRTTDGNGRFRVEDLPAGDYRISVRAGEGRAGAGPIRVDAGAIATAELPPVRPRN